MLVSRNESELIEAAGRGDGAAYAELLRPLYQGAFRLAYGLLHDPDEAEDAVQEASFRAWRKLGNLRAGASVRPWFLAIVANQCRSVTRSRWWSVVKAEPPEREALPIDIAGAVDLRRALMRLDHDERMVLVLHYYLDLPFKEILGRRNGRKHHDEGRRKHFDLLGFHPL